MQGEPNIGVRVLVPATITHVDHEAERFTVSLDTLHGPVTVIPTIVLVNPAADKQHVHPVADADD